jgi:hypothetical protein
LAFSLEKRRTVSEALDLNERTPYPHAVGFVGGLLALFFTEISFHRAARRASHGAAKKNLATRLSWQR